MFTACLNNGKDKYEIVRSGIRYKKIQEFITHTKEEKYKNANHDNLINP